MNRSVLVVATSDQPAMLRMKCPLVATTIAEYFRDQGNDVLLMMDSLTRYAMAQRDILLPSMPSFQSFWSGAGILTRAP